MRRRLPCFSMPGNPSRGGGLPRWNAGRYPDAAGRRGGYFGKRGICESVWRRAGGPDKVPVLQIRRLAVFTVTLALQCLKPTLFSLGLLVALLRAGDAVYPGVYPYLGAYLVPAALGVTALVLLLRRRLAFRFVYMLYGLLLCAGWLLLYDRARFMGASRLDVLPCIMAALNIAAWLVYVFTSDRVRVFCNRTPRRPAPMAAQARSGWDESGLVYTDADGRVTDFRGGPTRLHAGARVVNFPVGRTIKPRPKHHHKGGSQ